MLHTLRYLIGDEAFQTGMRRMAYPDPALEQVRMQRLDRYAALDVGIVSLVDDAGGAFTEHRADFVLADFRPDLAQAAGPGELFNRHGLAPTAAGRNPAAWIYRGWLRIAS